MGAQVARKDAAGHTIRGYIKAYDAVTALYEMVYVDRQTIEANVDSVNEVLQFRRILDEEPSCDGDVGTTSKIDTELVKSTLEGCKENWDTTSKYAQIKYDSRHWMANLSTMVAARKGSKAYNLFICMVSEALYKMHKDPKQGNTYKDVVNHLRYRGMTHEAR